MPLITDNHHVNIQSLLRMGILSFYVEIIVLNRQDDTQFRVKVPGDIIILSSNSDEVAHARNGYVNIVYRNKSIFVIS